MLNLNSLLVKPHRFQILLIQLLAVAFRQQMIIQSSSRLRKLLLLFAQFSPREITLWWSLVKVVWLHDRRHWSVLRPFKTLNSNCTLKTIIFDFSWRHLLGLAHIPLLHSVIVAGRRRWLRLPLRLCYRFEVRLDNRGPYSLKDIRYLRKLLFPGRPLLI